MLNPTFEKEKEKKRNRKKTGTGVGWGKGVGGAPRLVTPGFSSDVKIRTLKNNTRRHDKQVIVNNYGMISHEFSQPPLRLQ